MLKHLTVTLACLSLFLFNSCARAPIKGPKNAMRKINAPALSDDLPLEPLLAGIEAQIKFMETLPDTQFSQFIFGDQVFSRAEYLKGLRRFVELGRAPQPLTDFHQAVKNEFDFYEVYGRDHWGEVLVTSYYEPLIEGSLKPTAKFSQPLYKLPADIVSADLSLFDKKYEGDRKFRARLSDKALLPYYTREEIDSQGMLKGKKLELCYVDPLEAFFLQVQGSGTVKLNNGKTLHLNYAEANGHKYESIGQFLRPFIPKEQLNMHTILAYLRTLPPGQMQAILNMNKSYVFFRTTEATALTYLGVSATDGRSIATDKTHFPKGALAFLSFEKPVFTNDEDLVPIKTETTSRFVLDQDIGGAITGPGRVDLFWGRGMEAQRYGGAMKFPGRLIYLAPKKAGF